MQPDTDTCSNGLVEIALRVRESDRFLAAIELADTDYLVLAIGQHAGAVPSDKTFVDANLRLFAQIVVNPGDDNDELVSGIRCLAYQAGVIFRFSGLNMANDHAPAVPRTCLPGILKQSEYLVGDVVQCGKDIARGASALENCQPVIIQKLWVGTHLKPVRQDQARIVTE